jgi:N-acetylneuraminate synthase/N,N'-diacetyllegionaminate synthase
MKIGNIEIGSRIIIVAEIGGNHNGDFSLAKRMVHEAAAHGADVVKFQTYQAGKLVSKSLPPPKHVQGIHKTLHDRLRSLQFTNAQWTELKTVTDKKGLIFLSTPFDEESADFIDTLMPAFKIASGDLNNTPLLAHIAKKNKPIILSCGMADDREISTALNVLPKEKTILMHCVAKYPTLPEESNLLTIPYLKNTFGMPVGYSDHTIGIDACIAVATMGVVIIEKHFTLDKDQSIGDHKLSADPVDLGKLVKKIREVEKMMGVYGKPTVFDESSRKWLRRSIYAKIDIKPGTELTKEMLVLLRPSDGIPPEQINKVIGRKTRDKIPKGTQLKYSMFF